jgi:hypothetical protein
MDPAPLKGLAILLILAALAPAISGCQTALAADSRSMTSAAEPCGSGLAAMDLSGACRRLGPCRNDPTKLCTTMGALEAQDELPPIKGLRIRIAPPK